MPPTSRLNPAARLAAALAAAIATVIVPTIAAAPAFADDGGGAVTWSVQPADEKGPDGRSWIELTLDPGEKVTEHLALRNLSDTTQTFDIKAADGYITPTGRFNMLPSEQKSVDAGTWVTSPGSLEVASGKTVIVAFAVDVPANATPGDHAAGIAATVETAGTNADGNQVEIESRVGFPIMTRVTGELSPSLKISPVAIDYDMSWNPFLPGRVSIVYKIVNDGNVRMQASPAVTSQGSSAKTDAKAKPIELLPGEDRKVTTTVSGIWPAFFVPIEISLDPTVVTPEGEPKKADAIVQQFGVWAIPLPQLLVLLGVAFVVVALVAGRRRSRRRLEAAVAEAREAGRRSAAS